MPAIRDKIKYRNCWPESPIPSFGDILQLLCHNDSPDTLRLPWCPQGKNIYLFSRGTWAIAAFVKWVLNVTSKKILNIFLPDYFCNPTLKPLRQQNVKLTFYPVGENLIPDWNVVDEYTEKTGPPDIFILVHYFGFPCGAEKAHIYCQSRDAILLEDCAHVLCPTPMMGQKGHAVIYSLHKVLGVPDGGLLVINKNSLTELLKIKMQTLNPFDSLYKTNNKSSMPLTHQLFWIFKKMVQRLYFNFKISWNRMAAPRHDSAEEGVIKNIYGMSATTRCLLAVSRQKLKLFEGLRRKNYLALNEIVLEMGTIVRPLFNELPAHSIPYIYPAVVEPEYIEQLYSALNDSKIPAGTWPELPLEVRNSPDNHKTAIKMRQSIIVLPIHQSLSLKHITHIGRTLKSQANKLVN